MVLGTAQVHNPHLFRPQDASGWKPGLALAMFIHLFLVGALALGVHWKIKPPPIVEAEVWAELPRVQEEPPPQPVVVPPQPAELPPPVIEPVKPDIVVAPEKAKPKKIEKKEPKEVFLPDPPKKAPPKTPPPKPEVKPEKTPPKVVPPKAEAKPDPKAEAKAKAEKEAQAKVENEKLAAQRRANLDKLMKNLAQDQIASAGPSESYLGRLRARIRSNIVYSGQPSGLETLVRVECASDGRITGREVLASSGDGEWDRAVIRALDKTQVLPLDENKRIPCPFDFVFRPDR